MTTKASPHPLPRKGFSTFPWGRQDRLLLTGLIILVVLILPLLSYGALVNCGNTYEATDLETGKITTMVDNPCDFDDAVAMINGIINWIIGIAGIIFTITLIYAGFLYLTSGDDSGKRGKANSMLWNTVIGFVIILTAWLIVYTLLHALVPEGSSIFRFIKK